MIKEIGKYLFNIINLPYRIITESFTGDNGFFSSKKLTLFACIITALQMVYRGQILTPLDFDIFRTLLIAGGVFAGAGIMDRKINDSDQPDKTATTTNTIKTETSI